MNPDASSALDLPGTSSALNRPGASSAVVRFLQQHEREVKKLIERLGQPDPADVLNPGDMLSSLADVVNPGDLLPLRSEPAVVVNPGNGRVIGYVVVNPGALYSSAVDLSGPLSDLERFNLERALQPLPGLDRYPLIEKNEVSLDPFHRNRENFSGGGDAKEPNRENFSGGAGAGEEQPNKETDEEVIVEAPNAKDVYRRLLEMYEMNAEMARELHVQEEQIRELQDQVERLNLSIENGLQRLKVFSNVQHVILLALVLGIAIALMY